MSQFITIEGIEGAGKTTLREKITAHLQSQGAEVVLTREPGGTPFGKQVRSLILETQNLSSLAELLLFSADRAQHVSELIQPALSRGAYVICDRYYHSTLAYQGYARGLDIEELCSLCTLATGGLSPHLVLLLDLDPRVGLKRARERAGASGKLSTEDWNRFEEEKLEFHSKVRNGFLKMAEDPAEKFVVLDASKAPDSLAADAIAAINKTISDNS